MQHQPYIETIYRHSGKPLLRSVVWCAGECKRGKFDVEMSVCLCTKVAYFERKAFFIQVTGKVAEVQEEVDVADVEQGSSLPSGHSQLHKGECNHSDTVYCLCFCSIGLP